MIDSHLGQLWVEGRFGLGLHRKLTVHELLQLSNSLVSNNSRLLPDNLYPEKTKAFSFPVWELSLEERRFVF